jgi:ribosomal protein S15P/S13E
LSTAEQTVQLIVGYSKKGVRPSQITGNKVFRVLKASGITFNLPEELFYLIKKAVNLRKHLEKSRHDIDGKYHLILIESRIHRLARYYKIRRFFHRTGNTTHRQRRLWSRKRLENSIFFESLDLRLEMTDRAHSSV